VNIIFEGYRTRDNLNKCIYISTFRATMVLTFTCRNIHNTYMYIAERHSVNVPYVHMCYVLGCIDLPFLRKCMVVKLKYETNAFEPFSVHLDPKCVLNANMT
jgi:hypothetical protein